MINLGFKRQSHLAAKLKTFFPDETERNAIKILDIAAGTYKSISWLQYIRAFIDLVVPTYPCKYKKVRVLLYTVWSNQNGWKAILRSKIWALWHCINNLKGASNHSFQMLCCRKKYRSFKWDIGHLCISRGWHTARYHSLNFDKKSFAGTLEHFFT